MKLKVSKGSYLSSFSILLVSALIYILYQQLATGFEKNNWWLTEWMVNYQGGFVRRGLPGEIIYQLYQCFGIEPYSVIVGTALLFLVLIVVFFFAIFKNKGFPIFVLPLSFFLGYSVLSLMWLKKDNLLLFFFIMVIYLCTRVRIQALRFVSVNIVLVIGILSHEILAFVVLPILFLLMYAQSKDFTDKGKVINVIRSLPSSILFLLPSILIFFVVIFFHGDESVSHAIWDSWGNIPFPYPVDQTGDTMGAIGAIGWSSEFGVKYTLLIYLNKVDIAPIFSLIVILFSVYYILSNINKFDDKVLGCKPIVQDKGLVSSVLLFQFVFVVLLLLLIGCDTGRWIYYWVCSSFIVLCVIPNNLLRTMFTCTVTNRVDKLNTYICMLIGESKGLVIFSSLILGYATVFGFMSKVSQYVEFSSLYTVAKFISIFYNDLIDLMR